MSTTNHPGEAEPIAFCPTPGSGYTACQHNTPVTAHMPDWIAWERSRHPDQPRCNAPQPDDATAVCARVAGHSGDHAVPDRVATVTMWPNTLTRTVWVAVDPAAASDDEALQQRLAALDLNLSLTSDDALRLVSYGDVTDSAWSGYGADSAWQQIATRIRLQHRDGGPVTARIVHLPVQASIPAEVFISWLREHPEALERGTVVLHG